MAGECVMDPVLLDPCQRYLSPSLTSTYDVGTINALPYQSSGLSADLKYQLGSFTNQTGRAEGNLCPLITAYQHPPTPSNPVTHHSASSSSIGSLTTSSSVLSPEDIPKEVKNSSTRSKRKSATPTKSAKQKPLAEKTAKSTPGTRRQSKCEAIKANRKPSAKSKGENKRIRRQISLERNRVSASKCRKRKKQWTENLKQKKSGLESIHHELQAEYMNLLKESSQLKNYLLSHANCQDENIEVWLINEASKYVRTLHSANRVGATYSGRSLDGNNSTSMDDIDEYLEDNGASEGHSKD